MELYLIRHAQAAEPGARYPDDTERPLVPKGAAQAALLAEALERQGTRFTRLTSSPWLRARQTAEPLKPLASDELVLLDALAQGDPTETVTAFTSLLAESRSAVPKARDADSSDRSSGPCIAAVGHEPWMSMLASWLLCGRAHAMAVTFRKAAVMTLEGELRGGAMALTGFVPMRVVKALRDG